MPTPITVPRLGWTMEEGVFVGWLKNDGDEVRPGDMIFELESEKASQEVESLDGGVLHIPLDAPKPGDTVKVGAVLGFLVAPGEVVHVGLRVSDRGTTPARREATGIYTSSRITSASPSPPSAGGEGRGEGAWPAASHPQTPHPDPLPASGRGRSADANGTESQQALAAAEPAAVAGRKPPSPGLRISPRARRVARELGVDWQTLRGGGTAGRIRERDVRAAALGTPTTAQPSRPDAPAIPGRIIPLTPTRRIIARRMSAGVHDSAPVTLVTKADATNLVGLRRRLLSTAVPHTAAPSYTDIVVKIAAESLRQHPLLNAQWREEGIFVPDVIHIAVAVDTPDGLLAPVVRDAASLTLSALAAETRRLIESARRGTLKAAEMADATFTVSNLGPFGVDAFTPIINPPQCAVLGVGRIVREPAVVGDLVQPRDMVSLSLTFDHRIVDGAPAARFLGQVRRQVENPVRCCE